MIKKTRMVTLIVFMCFLSCNTMAAESKIAVVNVTDLFNSSTYVQKANKALQAKAEAMNTALKSAQNKLQEQINLYQSTPNSKKKDALAKKITSEQSRLNELAKTNQTQIQEIQTKGMQTFSQMVREAVETVAKSKNINNVLNSASLVYTDNSWEDITKEVAAVMEKK